MSKTGAYSLNGPENASKNVKISISLVYLDQSIRTNIDMCLNVSAADVVKSLFTHHFIIYLNRPGKKIFEKKR